MQAPDHRDLRHRSASGGISRRLLRDTRTMTDCLRLTGYALQEVLNLIGWTLATVFSILGLGRVAPAFEAMRRASERQRAWASERLGRRLIARYERSEPAPGTRGLAQLGAELQDPSRARDLDWHLVNPAASLASTALLLGIAVNGASMLLVSLAVIPDGDFYHWGYFVSWHDPTGAAWFLLGLAQLMAAPVLARLLQRVHARWVSFMLATGTSDSLEERVAALTATRKTALELQEAEIRRIERDLHDGAQARLVTMGMTLTQASRLLEHDPAAAKAMLDSAKDDSSAALKELRTLVRGIRLSLIHI